MLECCSKYPGLASRTRAQRRAPRLGSGGVTLSGTGPFRADSIVVRRDVFRGKVWTATPFRVVSDGNDQLAMAIWPGVERLAPTHQAALSSSQRDETVRNFALPNLASGSWELATWIWGTSHHQTTKLTLLMPGAYFSVDVCFRDAGDEAIWYVNFERPFQRTPIGIDTFDLLLDLVVEPDASFRWKDEDEYTHGRRLGIVSDDEHRQVQQAREQVLALLDRRVGPFDGQWLSWQPEAQWPLPVLPDNATTVPAAI